MTRITKWAGHAVKQTGWNLSPNAALSGLALVGGLALLAAFFLALSSQTAVLGRRLQDMEAERAMILRENAYLRDQIARAASMATLTQRALMAQFVTTGTIDFLFIAPTSVADDARSQVPP